MLQKKLNILGIADDNTFQYQKHFSLEQRQQKAQNIQQKMGSNRILVVVEKHKKSNLYFRSTHQNPWQIFVIDRSKGLVEFLIYIKQNVGISKQTSLFLYCNNKILMLKENLTVGQVFDENKNNEDEHLYIKYADFETFG